jgi:hypothetical protein
MADGLQIRLNARLGRFRSDSRSGGFAIRPL